MEVRLVAAASHIHSTNFYLWAANHRLNCHFTATSQLLKRINTELKLEQKPAEGLQNKFTSFELTIDGAVATLQHQHNQEKVKVQVDANSAIEAACDDMDFEEGEGEEELETEVSSWYNLSEDPLEND